MGEIQTLITVDAPVSRFKKPNPCVRAYGPGPDGKTCKSCVNLFAVQHGARRFTKCRLRGVTHGPGTDHRVNWPACGMWQAKEGE